MREAGLRIPKPLGHAVSIVGALVIGESAVSAGIISSSTLMVVATAAICSYVTFALYPPIMVFATKNRMFSRAIRSENIRDETVQKP